MIRFNKRPVAVLLSLLMVVCSLSGAAFATEDQDTAAVGVMTEEAAAKGSGMTGSGIDRTEVVTMDEPAAWDGSVDTSWYNVDATDLYIATPAGLAGLAAITNGTASDIEKDTFANKNVYLTSDLDLNGEDWIPIGNTTVSSLRATSNLFAGTFDGQNHKITGLYINDTSSFNRGLFGYVRGGTVKNLDVTGNVTVTRLSAGILCGSATEAVFETITTRGTLANTATSSTGKLGGVVGNADTGPNTISGSVNYANISTIANGEYYRGSYVGGIAGMLGYAVVTDCVNYGSVTSGYHVGGIIGTTYNNNSEIARCVNYGAITAAYSGTTSSYSTGGIVGNLYKTDTVSDCVNFGTVNAKLSAAGGIAGYVTVTSGTTVQNCYNAGTVTNTITTTSRTGGIIGSVYQSSYSRTATVNIESCYNRAAVSGTGEVGSIIGNAGQSSDTLVNNYYLSGTAEASCGNPTTTNAGTAFEAGSDYSDLIGNLGSHYTTDGATPVNDGYPILLWQDSNAKYPVAFALTLSDSANDGDAAVITVKDAQENAITPEEDGSYRLPNGTYTYEITKKGYETAADSFTVALSEKTIPVTLEAISYTWTFNVTPASADFSLYSSDSEKVTPDSSENGVYTFKLYNGTYKVKARAFGYEEDLSDGEVSRDITVSYADGTEDVTLKRVETYGSVTITAAASDGADISERVRIALYPTDGDYKDEAVYTDSSCDNLKFPTGGYRYKVQASGYAAAEGTFELTEAGYTADITLDLKTSWDGTSFDTDWYADENASDYYIYTADELAGLSDLVSKGNDFSGKTVHLMSSVNLGDASWSGIGSYYGYGSGNTYFSGTFDGHYNTVRIDGGAFNAASTSTGFGLFGALSDATIQNLITEGNVTADSSRYTYIGGIAGYATNSQFTNCSNRLSMNIAVTTSSTGFADVGGICGWSVYNSYDSCSNLGNISVTMEATGTSIAYVGGIAGMTTASSSSHGYHILDCYNTGNVSAEGARVCYAGGLVGNAGRNSTANTDFRNCFSTGTITNGTPLLGDGKYYQMENNYYLDTTLEEGVESTGEAKTAEDIASAGFVTQLGDKYKRGSVQPVLYWEAAPVSIEVETMPNKTVYDDFEDFVDTGLTLRLHYAEGDEGTVIPSGWQISGGTHLKAGTASVTASFMGVSCQIPITVNQIVHPITSSDLKLDITAPAAGETAQSEILLTDPQSEKYTASIQWTRAGEPFEGIFEDDTYYRAVITLKANYEDDVVWYNFDSDAEVTVDNALELLYPTLSEDKQTLTVTATFSLNSGISDKAAHLYYEGDTQDENGYGKLLNDALTIQIGDETASYTFKELETMALKNGLEKTYSRKGSDKVETGTYSGLSLWKLLLASGLSINTSDESTVTIGGKSFTIGQIRAVGGAYDTDGNALSEVPYALAFGLDGKPVSDPLILASPASSEKDENAENFVSGVKTISIDAVPARTFIASFAVTNENLDGVTVSITDEYGNAVYDGGLGEVTLNKGTNYSYNISAPGYGAKIGQVHDTDQITVTLLKLAADEASKYADDTYKPVQEEDGTYLVSNADELMWINYQSTRVSTEKSREMMGASIRLTDDIDMSGTEGMYIPMGVSTDNKIYFYAVDPSRNYLYYGGGAFHGNFDGDCHTIYNLNMDWENLYFLELAWDGSVMSYAYRIEYVGGLYGYALNANFANVGVEGNISVKDRPASTWADYAQIGGLVGYTYNCTIKECYTDMDLSYWPVTEGEYVGGYYTGGYPQYCDLYIGGIAGSLAGVSSIENCYSLGTINGGGVRAIRAGGIVGAARNVTNEKQQLISNCYASGNINVTPMYSAEIENVPTYVGGVVGATAALGGSSARINCCFGLMDEINVISVSEDFLTKYSHANRVFGDETSNGSYNFGLKDMEVNGATFTQNEDEESYRSAAGRSVTRDRACGDEVYTNVSWNNEDLIWDYSNRKGFPVFTWKKADWKAPALTLSVNDYNWTETPSDTGFDIYTNNLEVSVDATDGNSGIAEVYYAVSDELLQPSQITQWVNYTEPITIDKEGCYVFYAKAVDNEGNVTLVSSNGFVVDTTKPVITGAEDGKSYCEPVTLNISDANLIAELGYVTVNGERIPIDYTSLTINPADGVQTISATDRAGNTSSISITVYDGHAFGDGVITKSATETESGIMTYTCTRCGKTETRDIPPTGHIHSYVAVVTDPTCSNQEYTTYTCSGCGNSYMADYTEAAGHTWSEWTVVQEAGEKVLGIETRNCTVCGETETRAIPAVSCPSDPYTDVNKDAWYHTAIDFAIVQGVMKGTSSSTFVPEGKVSRAQFAQVIYNLEKGKAPEYKANFTDVADGEWYTGAVLWAAEKGYVLGYEDGSYRPNDDVTREQMAAILYRYFTSKGEASKKDADLSKFPDADQVQSWAVEAVSWANAEGVINGVASGSTVLLEPQGTATRAQLAQVVYNIYSDK